MKGIVFTEFLNMLDTKFEPLFIETLIEEANLPSGGIYTSIGTYNVDEMVALVTLLSEKTGLSVPALEKTFGEYLLGAFVRQHPQQFGADEDTFSILTQLNDSIHVDVRKLYPDAELPVFSHTWATPDRLELKYRSPRPFADVAEGLITGCIAHFGDDIHFSRQDIPTPEGAHAIFVLERPAA